MKSSEVRTDERLVMPDPVLNDNEFMRFTRYIHSISGINLHEGKKELVKARLGKILRQREFCSFSEYFDHVVNDRSGYELTILLNSISTNLTYFFRESEHYDFLDKHVIPEILEREVIKRGKNLRIWSAGCSSGEEAYSLAIAVSETLEKVHYRNFKILATDLSTKVLAVATSGVYEEKKLENIPYELKKKHFQRGDNKWKGYLRIKKKVRDKISFCRLNLMDDFQFGEPFDIIFCRNVMIYFDNATKESLVGKFFRSLSEGGYFFIGHAESLTGMDHRFKYVQPSVYKKI